MAFIEKRKDYSVQGFSCFLTLYDNLNLAVSVFCLIFAAILLKNEI